jgi:hypothetical protein
MSRERICAWLKIAPTPWPPDPYALLGLAPGETDPDRIEMHVQIRLEQVRCYQLIHPEAATEAMQLLAKAFDLLHKKKPQAKPAVPPPAPEKPAAAKPAKPTVRPPSDKKPKPATALPPPPPVEPAPQVAVAAAPPAAPPATEPPAGQDPLAWIYGPWNAPGPARPPGSETIDLRSDRSTQEMPAIPPPEEAPPAPVPEPPSREAIDEAMDVAIEAARSAPARRGLSTKGAIYNRISRARRLLRAWAQAGNYLADPVVRLNRRGEAIDLVRQLTVIRQQLKDFPPLLGQAGQPGYLVVVLARQPEIVKTFQEMGQAQRAMLVRDWESGLSLLAAYRLFLRQEIRSMRRKGRIGRFTFAARSLLAESAGLWLFLLGLVALNLVLRPSLAWWLGELALAVILLAGLVIIPRMLRENTLRRSRRRPNQAAR